MERASYPIGERIISEKAAGKPNSFEKAVSDRNTILLLYHRAHRQQQRVPLQRVSYRRSSLVPSSATKKARYTHFVSLMLIVNRLERHFNAFNDTYQGVPAIFFIFLINQLLVNNVYHFVLFSSLGRNVRDLFIEMLVTAARNGDG